MDLDPDEEVFPGAGSSECDSPVDRGDSECRSGQDDLTPKEREYNAHLRELFAEPMRVLDLLGYTPLVLFPYPGRDARPNSYLYVYAFDRKERRNVLGKFLAAYKAFCPIDDDRSARIDIRLRKLVLEDEASVLLRLLPKEKQGVTALVAPPTKLKINKQWRQRTGSIASTQSGSSGR